MSHRVALGRPLNTSYKARIEWCLKAIHELELVSGHEDEEVAARLAKLEKRIADLESRMPDDPDG